MIEQTHFILPSGKRYRKHPVTLRHDGDRIWFVESPFALKDEIKAMQGAKWHGFDDDPVKQWSIKDTPRNRFNLGYLKGENVYEWFDRRVEDRGFSDFGGEFSLMPHQIEMASSALTHHYQIWAVEMGAGKSAAAQAVIEKSGKRNWLWVGPKNTLPTIQFEFEKFSFPFSKFNVRFISFEQLVKAIAEGLETPDGMIVDEASKVKTATAQRSKAVQSVADRIRDKHGYDGFVILMTGTPATKSPTHWWKQCEIAWPGFLREGSPQSLEKRLAFMVAEEYAAGVFNKRVGWRDDERKCNICGKLSAEHTIPNVPASKCASVGPDEHYFEPSVNEIALLYDRLKGLVIIKHKKDCISLPDKRYRTIQCKPSSSILRAAKTLADSAPNTITGLTWLRELSDGFLYRDEKDGVQKCDHCTEGKSLDWQRNAGEFEQVEITCPKCNGAMEVPRVVRVSKEIPCPKIDELKNLLLECDETGRIVIFAGFTGSIDRITAEVLKAGWGVWRCDGRGQSITTKDGQLSLDPLRYWKNWDNPRVAFVAHPKSGGYGLTLTESRMAVFYSNVHESEVRVQAEDRIHRKGMDENLGCEIVDLLHLPTDERVLEIVREDRRIEMMTMGQITEGIDWESE
jgi:hypothetical protein